MVPEIKSSVTCALVLCIFSYQDDFHFLCRDRAEWEDPGGICKQCSGELKDHSGYNLTTKEC